MHVWGTRLSGEGRFGEFEQLILAAAFAEYLAQISGGIPMSQLEFVRPEALGVPRADVRRFEDEVADMVAAGSTQDIKTRLAELIAAQPDATTFGDSGLDETHAAIHDQMRKFSEAEVVPHAHEWHLKNEYIPLEVIAKVAELGVFGLTLPEEYGGLGLGKEAMCVVSEELSRGYIGVGSLGTRSEIAGELILNNGTDEQKAKYLPQHRDRRDAAHRRVHRAQHRLRPRLAQDARGEGRRQLQGHRPEDVDHASRARRPDDTAGAHQSRGERLQGPLHAAGRKAARLRCRSVPGARA